MEAPQCGTELGMLKLIDFYSMCGCSASFLVQVLLKTHTKKLYICKTGQYHWLWLDMDVAQT